MQNPHGLVDSRIKFPFRNPILRDIKIPIQESSPLRRFLHSIFQIPIPNSQHWHSNSQSKSYIEGGLRTLLVSCLFQSQYVFCRENGGYFDDCSIFSGNQPSGTTQRKTVGQERGARIPCDPNVIT